MTKPSRSAILHIGTEKTGTTTLQVMLAGKRPALADLGYRYASAPGDISHTALAAYAAPENMPGMFSEQTPVLAQRRVRR